MARVLLIDDESDVLCICRINLQGAGHEVWSSTSGTHGLEIACAQAPEAIVLDLMMPHMDGFEVLDALRSSEKTCEIPVLVLTAKVAREDAVASWRRGAAEFLTKPFSPELLIESVHRVLQMSPRVRAARRVHALAALAHTG